MYRLLIVDDEAIIADGLYEVFQNIKNLDLDIYKAYSGSTALELLEKTRIDIVLSDIRMPQIDGLQLLKKIRENWPKCRVIFLTGYNEFDYVYSAIKYPGVNYLLKTEGYSKIIESVKKAMIEIDEDIKTEELIENAKKQLITMSQLLKNNYLSNLIKGEFTKEELTQKQFTELDIPLSAEKPVIVLIGTIDFTHNKLQYSEKIKLQCSINLIMEQYLQNHVSYIHFVHENSNLIWLIQPQVTELLVSTDSDDMWKKTLNFVKGNLELVQAFCKTSLDILVSFALDDSGANWLEVSDRFAMLKTLLNYRIGQNTQMLITDKNIAGKDLQQITKDTRNKAHIRQKKLEQLSIYLENGNKDEFDGIFSDITCDFINLNNIHDSKTEEIYYSIALVFLSYINKWNLLEKISFKINLYKLMKLNEYESFHDALEYLRKISSLLFELQDYEEEKRAQNTVNKIIKYIDDNIGEDLSLVKLSEVVYFNPSYLSRLFKQVVGENLSDYICKMKIIRAKQLLEKPEMKIHEIAAAMGYYSTTNFIRFFKKLTNMTPQEYRDFL